jgi:hypothetical protein
MNTLQKIVLIMLLIPNIVIADNVQKKCFSKSGKSSYDINLDTLLLKGVVEYKFMGQDITYEILSAEYKNGVFSGIASFLKSRSGETHDEPFIISYDSKSNTLKELTTYTCH